MSTKAQKAADEAARRNLILSAGQQAQCIAAKLEFINRVVADINSPQRGQNIHVLWNPKTKSMDLRLVAEDKRNLPDSSFELQMASHVMAGIPLVHVSQIVQHRYKYMMTQELSSGGGANHFLTRTGHPPAEIGPNHIRLDGIPAYSSLYPYNPKSLIISNIVEVEANIRAINQADARDAQIVLWNAEGEHAAGAIAPAPIEKPAQVDATFTPFLYNGTNCLLQVMSDECRYNSNISSNGFQLPYTPDHPGNDVDREDRRKELREFFMWMAKRFVHGNYLLHLKLLNSLRKAGNSFLMTQKYINDVCLEYKRVCEADYVFRILDRNGSDEIISPTTLEQCTFGSAFFTSVVNVLFQSARVEGSTIPYFERCLNSFREDTEGILFDAIIGVNDTYCTNSPNPGDVFENVLVIRTNLESISAKHVLKYSIERVKSDITDGVIYLILKGDVFGDFADLYQQGYSHLLLEESKKGRNDTPSWEILEPMLRAAHATAMTQMHAKRARSSTPDSAFSAILKPDMREPLFNFGFEGFVLGPASGYDKKPSWWRCRFCLLKGVQHHGNALKKDPNFKLIRDNKPFRQARSRWIQTLADKRAEKEKGNGAQGGRKGRSGPRNKEKGSSDREKARKKREKRERLALAAQEADEASDSDSPDEDPSPVTLVASLKGKLPCAKCFASSLSFQPCPSGHTILIATGKNAGKTQPADTKRAWRAVAETNETVQAVMNDKSGAVYLALHPRKKE